MRLLLTSLALAACAKAGGALPSENAVVLPGSAVEMMLNQCSRGTPEAGEASWQPGGEDIAALEAALPAALAARHRSSDPDWSGLDREWRRQYVGIVRGGRRFVYGNFFPRDVGEEGAPGRWRAEPVIVCDGGAAFFGVEYDVELHGITHLDFNGFA